MMETQQELLADDFINCIKGAYSNAKPRYSRPSISANQVLEEEIQAIPKANTFGPLRKSKSIELQAYTSEVITHGKSVQRMVSAQAKHAQYVKTYPYDGRISNYPDLAIINTDFPSFLLLNPLRKQTLHLSPQCRTRLYLSPFSRRQMILLFVKRFLHLTWTSRSSPKMHPG